MVEVRVADQHCHDRPRHPQEAIDALGVGQRRPPPQQPFQRRSREVGIDHQRLVLVRQPVPRNAKPLDLKPGGQAKRARLQLPEDIGVFALVLLPRDRELQEAQELAHWVKHLRKVARQGVAPSRIELLSRP